MDGGRARNGRSTAIGLAGGFLVWTLLACTLHLPAPSMLPPEPPPPVAEVSRREVSTSTMRPAWTVPPAHRGEGNLAARLGAQSYVRGRPGAGPDGESYYVPVGSLDLAAGFRFSRIIELRASGSLGVPWGAYDTYESQRLGASTTGTAGLGVALGFASDGAPFQIQLVTDTGVSIFEKHQLFEARTRTCRPDRTCTAWGPVTTTVTSRLDALPYARASIVVGVDVVPELRLYAQGGIAFDPVFEGDEYGYRGLTGLFDLSAELTLTHDLSVVAQVCWAAADPVVDHGPGGSLGIRWIAGDGPGSSLRERRAVTEREERRERRRLRRLERGLLDR